MPRKYTRNQLHESALGAAVTVVAGMKIADEVEAGAGSTDVKYARWGSCIHAYNEDGNLAHCFNC